MRPSVPAGFRAAKRVEPRSPFAPKTVLMPTTESKTWTTKRQKEFNHLLRHRVPWDVHGAPGRRLSGAEPSRTFVHWDDRIKFWNITAGDKVMIADGPAHLRGEIGTVYWVNRHSNEVALLEDKFWAISEKRSNHYRATKLPVSLPIRFEYTTVRLIPPEYDDTSRIYFEELHECKVTEHHFDNPNKDGRAASLSWERWGTPCSVDAPNPIGPPQRIPWPEQPRWSTMLPTASERIAALNKYYDHVQDKNEYTAQVKAYYAAQAGKKAAKKDGSDVAAVEGDGETLKHPGKFGAGKKPYGFEQPEGLTPSPNYECRPEQAWNCTLTSRPYHPQRLSLLSSPEMRDRWPEYFKLPPVSADPTKEHIAVSQLDSSQTAAEPSWTEQYAPDLIPEEWEFSHGWWTKRAMIERYENRRLVELEDIVEEEWAELAAGASAVGKALDEVKTKDMLRLLHPFKSKLVPPPSKEENKRRIKAMKQAKHAIDNLRRRYAHKSLRAARDLLPELEQFNTKRLLEHIHKAGTTEGGDGKHTVLRELRRVLLTGGSVGSASPEDAKVR